MSQILITWPELQALDFPRVCFACGARATRVDSWKFSVVSHQLFSTLTRYQTVEVPVCPDHWNNRKLGGVKATRFTDDGIWFKNVSPDFIEALWDHREEMDRAERRLRREMEELGEADPESRGVDRWGRRLAPPRPRPRRGDRRFEKPASNTGVILLIVFGVIAAVILVGCLGLLMFGHVTRQPVNPGFNPGFDNPPFNNPPPGNPFPRRKF
jgi:hypothetical protein